MLARGISSREEMESCLKAVKEAAATASTAATEEEVAEEPGEPPKKRARPINGRGHGTGAASSIVVPVVELEFLQFNRVNE